MLQELIVRRPDFAPAYLALGDVHFRRGEFADAQQAYRQYLMYEPAHEGALTNLGISALNAGQPDEGIKALQRVVDARPQQASAHRNLAIALANAGRIDQAIVHVKEAARLAPGDATIEELFQQLQASKPVNR
jgi:Flp pilus assembly protein TadD